METIPGILLFFRRTTLIASLVLLGVMGNVVMLNFCYDVPVKIYSTLLWIMALFLVLPDARRVFAALVLGRATPGAAAPSAAGRAQLARKLAFGLLAATLALTAFESAWSRHRKYATPPPEHPVAIHGLYRVFEMTLDGKPLAELPAAARWTHVALGARRISVSGEIRSDWYRPAAEIAGPGPIEISRWEDAARARHALLDARGDGETLTLEGQWDGKPLRVVGRKMQKEPFLLMTRGFHWVNERPFNR
jgi:hypothetical protein